MASLRIEIDNKVAYEGPAGPVPRVGDDIKHDGNIVRIDSVVWDFSDAGDVIRVTIGIADRPYTF
jgi:hypothetical protein